MNRLKLPLKNLLTILAALVFGFYSYLGFNFSTLGNTGSSITAAALISFLLGAIAIALVYVKGVSKNFKTFIFVEGALILSFLVVSFFSISYFSHFFNVSSQKEIIQKQINSNIVLAETLYIDYESYAERRLTMYEERLKSFVNAKDIDPMGYIDAGFDPSVDGNTQIENKMFTLKAQLYPSNYAASKSEALKWLAQAKSKVSPWSPTGVVDVVNNLDGTISDWNNQLKLYSLFRAKGELPAYDFDLPLSFADVSGMFKKGYSPNPMAMIVGIVLYILMLLSYFITKRHPRYPGLKVIFNMGGTRDNEL